MPRGVSQVTNKWTSWLSWELEIESTGLPREGSDDLIFN
jgi:hypothetical protein